MAKHIIARPSEDEVKQTIAGVVNNLFTEGNIVGIDIDFKDHYEFGELIEVRIVFDHKIAKLDPEKTLRLGTDLAYALDKIDEDRFPLLRFISKSEYKGLPL